MSILRKMENAIEDVHDVSFYFLNSYIKS